MKTEAEIKAQIKLLGAILLEHNARHAIGEIEAQAAMLLMQALAWTIGELPTPTTRLRHSQLRALLS